jgi:hypothetical protein
MATQCVLCANPFCLIVVRDGLVFLRRPNLPDEQKTDTPAETTAFLESAHRRHGALRVVDAVGNPSPVIPIGLHHPCVRERQLVTGERVYEMLAEELV